MPSFPSIVSLQHVRANLVHQATISFTKNAFDDPLGNLGVGVARTRVYPIPRLSKDLPVLRLLVLPAKRHELSVLPDSLPSPFHFLPNLPRCGEILTGISEPQCLPNAVYGDLLRGPTDLALLPSRRLVVKKCAFVLALKECRETRVGILLLGKLHELFVEVPTFGSVHVIDLGLAGNPLGERHESGVIVPVQVPAFRCAVDVFRGYVSSGQTSNCFVPKRFFRFIEEAKAKL